MFEFEVTEKRLKTPEEMMKMIRDEVYKHFYAQYEDYGHHYERDDVANYSTKSFLNDFKEYVASKNVEELE